VVFAVAGVNASDSRLAEGARCDVGLLDDAKANIFEPVKWVGEPGSDRCLTSQPYCQLKVSEVVNYFYNAPKKSPGECSPGLVWSPLDYLASRVDRFLGGIDTLSTTFLSIYFPRFLWNFSNVSARRACCPTLPGCVAAFFYAAAGMGWPCGIPSDL
jgi:hypothetical protein